MFDDDARFESTFPAELKRLLLYDIRTRAAYLKLRGGKDQIGGYHYSSQGWDPRDRKLARASELLLQVDGCGPISWGDLGTACFFVPTEDLAALRFDRVLYHWDCT